MAESRAQQVAVVTGASSGIGLHTALGLARAGMRVVLLGRDRTRTETARRFVTERSGSDRVETAVADFRSSPKSGASRTRSCPLTTGSMYSSTMPACFHRNIGFRRMGSSLPSRSIILRRFC
jgi:NAD(P)-dependent dehydrogenase (short-subunit alcohol dehydrogenase family)